MKPISFIQIELTNHCNYKCRFCPQSQWNYSRHDDRSYNRKKGYMSFDLYEKILNQADKITREINFSFFGEPLMHPEFTKFLDRLKTRDPGLKVVMNTNLSLATKATFEKLIEIQLDELRLSIDASSSETYEIVRPGNWGLDLEGNPHKYNRLDMINRKAEYWFSLPKHRPTRHVFTINSKNKNEVNAFAKYWISRLGDKDTILFKNVLSYGGKIGDELIYPHSCNVWDLRSLTIDWQGRVTPCNLDTNMDLSIGSVVNATLSDLIASEKMQQIKHLSKGRKITSCRECCDANNWSGNLLLGKGDKLTKKLI